MSTIFNAKQRGLFVQAVLLTLLLASCAKEEVPTYSVGTGGWAGGYQNAGIALVRIVNKNKATNGFLLQDEISAGSIANINAIVSGEAQFGIAQADDQYHAFKGMGEWAAKGPQGDLRSIFSMYTESVTLVAGGDTGIRSINDLKGKRVDIGLEGSGTRRNAIDALRAADIDWKNDLQAYGENLDDRLAMLMRGELDAFFFTVGHPNREIKFATFSVRGARIIPLENIDQLVSASPYFSRTVIPGGMYPMTNNNDDVETLGVNATLLVSASISDDVVYAVTKAIFEDLDSLADFNAELSSLKNGTYLESLTAPVHPGALRYYREIGVDMPPG